MKSRETAFSSFPQHKSINMSVYGSIKANQMMPPEIACEIANPKPKAPSFQTIDLCKVHHRLNHLRKGRKIRLTANSFISQ